MKGKSIAQSYLLRGAAGILATRRVQPAPQAANPNLCAAPGQVEAPSPRGPPRSCIAGTTARRRAYLEEKPLPPMNSLRTAEAAVALAIILNFYNNHATVDVDEGHDLKG